MRSCRTSKTGRPSFRSSDCCSAVTEPCTASSLLLMPASSSWKPTRKSRTTLSFSPRSPQPLAAMANACRSARHSLSTSCLRNGSSSSSACFILFSSSLSFVCIASLICRCSASHACASSASLGPLLLQPSSALTRLSDSYTWRVTSSCVIDSSSAAEPSTCSRLSARRSRNAAATATSRMRAARARSESEASLARAIRLPMSALP